MLLIGIPTYNESDNIQNLVKAIDSAAERIGINICIINSDNNSPDGTSTLFESVETKCKKISICCAKRGKGRNIRAILEKCLCLQNMDGLVLIDGDITSFNDEWLVSFSHELLDNQCDFCVPLYSRNYQEGNTTNHFVYPLLFAHSGGLSPRQPICGDFGLSKKFIEFLMGDKCSWNKFAYGYGIDVFLTMNAIFGGFAVSEIKLDKKIHKPSFGKMVNMFLEVSSSYYEVAKFLIGSHHYSDVFCNVRLLPNSQELYTPTMIIDDTQILERAYIAKKFFLETRTLIRNQPPKDFFIDSETWNDVLSQHEYLLLRNRSEDLASSILPWYLMRVVGYLRECHSAAQAEAVLKYQLSNLKIRSNYL